MPIGITQEVPGMFGKSPPAQRLRWGSHARPAWLPHHLFLKEKLWRGRLLMRAVAVDVLLGCFSILGKWPFPCCKLTIATGPLSSLVNQGGPVSGKQAQEEGEMWSELTIRRGGLCFGTRTAGAPASSESSGQGTQQSPESVWRDVRNETRRRTARSWRWTSPSPLIRSNLTSQLDKDWLQEHWDKPTCETELFHLWVGDQQQLQHLEASQECKIYLLNQNLHFKKIPRGFEVKLDCERHDWNDPIPSVGGVAAPYLDDRDLCHLLMKWLMHACVSLEGDILCTGTWKPFL